MYIFKLVFIYIFLLKNLKKTTNIYRIQICLLVPKWIDCIYFYFYICIKNWKYFHWITFHVFTNKNNFVLIILEQEMEKVCQVPACLTDCLHACSNHFLLTIFLLFLYIPFRSEEISNVFCYLKSSSMPNSHSQAHYWFIELWPKSFGKFNLV